MLNLALIEARIGLLVAIRYAPVEWNVLSELTREMHNTCRVVERRARIELV